MVASKVSTPAAATSGIHLRPLQAGNMTEASGAQRVVQARKSPTACATEFPDHGLGCNEMGDTASNRDHDGAHFLARSAM